MVIGIAAAEIFSSINAPRENVAKEFVRALIAGDSSNSYVLFSRHVPSIEFSDRARLKNVRVGGISGWFWDQLALPKAIKREKCDVLLNLGFTGPLKPGIPDLYILPYYWGNLLWDSLYGFGNFTYNKPSVYQRYVSKSLIYSCNRLILSTHFEMDHLVKRYFTDLPTDKLVVIQAGVTQCESDSFTEAEVAQVQQRFDLPEKYILMIGNPNPLCNTQSVILGYKRMVKELTVRIPIVLVGVSKSEVISYVGKDWFSANSEKFILISQITGNEKTILIKGAILFFALSYYEKWCLNIMEAISCGVPIVTTANSSLSEIAQGAAILVDPKNPIEVSEAGRLVLIDKRCVLGLSKKGVERSMVYQWSNSAKKLIALMETFKQST
ncbi:glycosyltransferase [Williamwhitmania taraxaci]|uniref:Glycosyltransferase involved in cell wall bisynthesis n=1 Tax=Williamwhitmania taraxaci TaxID=1640674 RepID=A0A1G6GQ04_9BACT|nr:glycosyltransferase [Williamwhitmania taraxaci]SDB83286.1 Glycosyltransferase involved in cell wall bisynthesis [Williamwhitmania taraxaci]